MVAMSSCQGLVDAVRTNNAVTMLSASYTFVVAFLCSGRLLGRPPVDEVAPLRAARFWIAVALPKLTVAILLFSALMPPCSEECPCLSPEAFYVYPTLSVLVSTLWLLRGAKNLRLARRLRAVGGGEEATSTDVLDSPGYDLVPATAKEPSSPLAADTGEMA
jgi:hypothetical protein